MASFKTSLRELKEALRKSEPDDLPQEPAPRTGGDGVLSVVQRHSEESLASTGKLLAQDPNNRDLMDWYAFMLYSNDRCHEAVEIYRRLLAKDGTVVEHLYYMGCCLYRLGKLEEAVSSWREAHDRDPGGTYGRKAREKMDVVYDRDYARLSTP